MKFRHWSTAKPLDMTISQAIEYEVSSQNSERGVVEDCEKKIDCLTRIVAEMAESLPMEAQVKLAKQLTFHTCIE